MLFVQIAMVILVGLTANIFQVSQKEVRNTPAIVAGISLERNITNVPVTSVTPTLSAGKTIGNVRPTIGTTTTPAVTTSVRVTNQPNPTNTSGDKEAPTWEYLGGPQNGGVYDFTGFCFPMKLNDNYSDGIFVRYKYDAADWSNWGFDGEHLAPCFQNVSAGSHTFWAQGKDAAGNETSVMTRTFTIQRISNATPVPTSRPNPTVTPAVTIYNQPQPTSVPTNVPQPTAEPTINLQPAN